MHIMYFTERPYRYVPNDEVIRQGYFGIENKHFDSVKGAQLLNEYLDEKVIAEELGFDGVMLNEHHDTAFCMGSVMNVEASILARITQRVKIVLLGNPLPIVGNPLSLAEELGMIDMISGGLTVEGPDSRAAAAQAAVRQLLPDFDDAEFATFVSRGYPFYWLSFDPSTHARHARLMREAEASGAPLAVEKRVDPQRSVTEITLYTADHPGLFSRIAGALAVSGANIVDAKIMTMSNGMALDAFWVQDSAGAPFGRPEKLATLAMTFESVLTGDLNPRREFARKPAFSSRTRVFTVTPRVLVDNKASASHTVVEVNGRDRPGLLFELTRALTGLNLQVSSAKISTYV